MTAKALGTHHAGATADRSAFRMPDQVFSGQLMPARAVRASPRADSPRPEQRDGQPPVVRVSHESLVLFLGRPPGFPSLMSSCKTTARQVDAGCHGFPVHRILASPVQAVFSSRAVHVPVVADVIDPEVSRDQAGCQFPARNMRGNGMAIPVKLSVAGRADNGACPWPAVAGFLNADTRPVPHLIRCRFQGGQLGRAPEVLTRIMSLAQPLPHIRTRALPVGCGMAGVIRLGFRRHSARTTPSHVTALAETPAHSFPGLTVDALSQERIVLEAGKKSNRAPAAGSGAGSIRNNRKGARK